MGSKIVLLQPRASISHRASMCSETSGRLERFAYVRRPSEYRFGPLMTGPGGIDCMAS
jgi:hypothetical protein